MTAAAGTGIGSAVARRALAEGADVVVSDHHERRLGETRDQLAELGLGRVESVVCDVTSTAQVDALISSTTARMGRLDVLVNNAGLGGETPVVDMTDEEWDRVLNVTLTSVMRATRAALRYFRDADHGGVIVNNASVLGWRAQHSQSHYAAAKAGVMALTRCSAIEAVEHGVRINAVSPSIARHKFLEKTELDRPARPAVGGRGVRPRRRAVGGRRHHRVPGQRLLQLPDRRSDFGIEPARMTEQPSVSRRDELLELAATMFAERGLRATTVRDIADSAGILSGSLYHHFKSKEQMVEEVLRDFLDWLFARYQEIVETEPNPLERLKGLFMASFEAIEHRHAQVVIYQDEAKRLSGQPRFYFVEERNKEQRKMWLDVLNQGVEEGYFRPDIDVDLVYRFIRDTTWVSVRWYQPGGPLTAEAGWPAIPLDCPWRHHKGEGAEYA